MNSDSIPVEALRFIGAGALLLAVGIGLGAFGAHGLKEKLDAYHLAVYEKAVFYHLIHALAIVVLASLVCGNPIFAKTLRVAVLLFIAGIALFSGSLYLLSVTGIRWLGAITPFGGSAFIAGWLVLAYRCLVGRG